MRGGSYSREVLSRTDIKALSKELRHADGGCLRCGRQSHWATDCYANTDVCGNAISDDEYDEEQGEDDSRYRGRTGRGAGAGAAAGRESSKREAPCSSPGGPSKRSKHACQRCGRDGHWVRTRSFNYIKGLKYTAGRYPVPPMPGVKPQPASSRVGSELPLVC